MLKQPVLSRIITAIIALEKYLTHSDVVTITALGEGGQVSVLRERVLKLVVSCDRYIGHYSCTFIID